MFEVLIQHELWTTVVLYWIFSAAVSAMLGNKGVRTCYERISLRKQAYVRRQNEEGPSGQEQDQRSRKI